MGRGRGGGFRGRGRGMRRWWWEVYSTGWVSVHCLSNSWGQCMLVSSTWCCWKHADFWTYKSWNENVMEILGTSSDQPRIAIFKHCLSDDRFDLSFVWNFESCSTIFNYLFITWYAYSINMWFQVFFFPSTCHQGGCVRIWATKKLIFE